MTSFIIFLTIVTFVGAVGAIRAPFLTKQEAFQVLGHPDMGRFPVLTSQLGMRADMEYGWEEMYYQKRGTQNSVILQLETALASTWLPDGAGELIANEIALGSVVRLGRLSERLAKPIDPAKLGWLISGFT